MQPSSIDQIAAARAGESQKKGQADNPGEVDSRFHPAAGLTYPSVERQRGRRNRL